MQPTREPSTAAALALARLARLHAERGSRFPRCALLVLVRAAEQAVATAWLRTLPAGLAQLLSEVALLVDGTEGAPDFAWPNDLALANVKVRANPRRYGFGGRRKVAFEYALEREFDHVLIVDPVTCGRTDDLAHVWLAAVESGAEIALALPRASSMRLRLSSLLHRAVLGSRMHDGSADTRCYAVDFLRRIPFQLDADDRRFDTQILIQARALGVASVSIELDAWPTVQDYSVRASLDAALAYRLHQLHVLRLGQYLVDHGLRYTLKRSPSSSHAQILSAIRPGSRVLDLGCSQGLLARPLREKGVRVTGVDVLPAEKVALDLDAYHRCDLEEPLRLSEGRVFDYVVLSDVLEHVIHREQLLRSARRHLVPSGRLLISTPNIAIWFYRLSLAVGRFEYGPRGVLDETHVHLFTRATFRREVERGGFRILRQRVTALPFEVVLESTGESRVIALLSSTYHLLARAWPKLFAYQFLFEAEVMTLLDDADDATKDPEDIDQERRANRFP